VPFFQGVARKSCMLSVVVPLGMSCVFCLSTTLLLFKEHESKRKKRLGIVSRLPLRMPVISRQSYGLTIINYLKKLLLL
jgi:hypothetical protein